MKNAALSASLSLLRCSGFFDVARQVTKRGLRIICYHGFSLADEHKFSSHTFMQPTTFFDRMERLYRSRYPVVSLDAVLSGDYPDQSVVITIDDGWSGTDTIAAPILKRFNFPATVYLTTYYSKTRTQVFNVALRYILWKTKVGVTTIPGLGVTIDLENNKSCLSTLMKMGESLPADERQELLNQIGEVCDVDAKPLFRLMSLDDLTHLHDYDIDIQLHTHRHRFSFDSDELYKKEVIDNLQTIYPYSKSKLQHFCYPSGIINDKQIAVLRSLGICTAVTTKRKINFTNSHPLLLGRFLDAEHLSPNTFDAELSGLLDLIRYPSLLFSSKSRKSCKLGKERRLEA